MGTIITVIAGLFSSGGVIYLLVDKLIASRKEKADATDTIIDSVSDYMKELHAEMKEEREYARSNAESLKEDIAQLQSKVNTLSSSIIDLLEENCCVRNCDNRQRNPKYDNILKES